MVVKLAVISGSLRKDSYNKKLAKICVDLVVKNYNGQATFIDLKDYGLPNYDGDIEENDFPKSALKLQSVFKEHNGFIFCSPEYNSSISGALKNAIDWISRDGKGGGDLSCFSDKPALLLSTSPGQLGGLRGLNILRSLLSNIGVICYSKQLAIPFAMNVFADLKISEPKSQEMLNSLIESFVNFSAKVNV